MALAWPSGTVRPSHHAGEIKRCHPRANARRNCRFRNRSRKLSIASNSARARSNSLDLGVVTSIKVLVEAIEKRDRVPMVRARPALARSDAPRVFAINAHHLREGADQPLVRNDGEHRAIGYDDVPEPRR